MAKPKLYAVPGDSSCADADALAGARIEYRKPSIVLMSLSNVIMGAGNSQQDVDRRVTRYESGTGRSQRG